MIRYYCGEVHTKMAVSGSLELSIGGGRIDIVSDWVH